MTKYLFVYGTLRKGYPNAHAKLLEKSAIYSGQGFIFGKLYEISDFPGVVLSAGCKDKVYGDVYDISDERKHILSITDRYEGISIPPAQDDLYQRVCCKVYINSSWIEAYTYVLSRERKGLKWIDSGDYLAYSGHK